MSESYVIKDRNNFWQLNWLDEYMVGHNGFIAGGCFKNIFQKETVKDLDIFFECEEDWDEAVEYYDSHTAGYGFEPDVVTHEQATYRFLYENDKVKAYVNIKTNVRIELNKAIFGTPEKILSQFDFTLTKFAYYKDEVPDDDSTLDDIKTHTEYKVICHKDFFEHLHLKRLVIDDKIPYPMSSFERMIRYIKYGYMPCRDTKISLAKAINNLSIEKIEVSNSLYNGWD